MAQTVNPATSIGASIEADLTAGSKGSLQATITAFVDVLVDQGANAGASPIGLGSTQAPTSPPKAATMISNLLANLAQQQTDKAVSQVVAAQSSLDKLQAAAAAGNSSAQAKLNKGSAQASLTNAEANLSQAINNEISATVSPNANAADLITAAANIAARYANDPASSAIVATTALEVLFGRLVKVVDKSGLVYSKTLIQSAFAGIIADFEKFSKSSPNHVRPNIKPEAWLEAENRRQDELALGRR